MATLYLIYHPLERTRADKFAHLLRAEEFDVKVAPLGLQTSSNEWKDKVQKDIEASDLAIILLTKLSLNESSVLWRVETALKKKIPIIPIVVELDVHNFYLQVKADVQKIVGGETTEKPDFVPEYIRGNLLDFVFNQFNTLTYIESSHRNQSSEEYLAKLEQQSIEYITHSIKNILPLRKRIFCFLSYSRKDSDFASKLSTSLQAKEVKVWRDINDIRPGTNWDQEIEKAIKKCSHLLVIASQASVSSPNVQDEISLALERRKNVIPLLIEECQLPMRVHRAQRIDFSKNFETGMEVLLQALGITNENS